MRKSRIGRIMLRVAIVGLMVLALGSCSNVLGFLLGGVSETANPTYGEVTLASGFSPDPYTVNLVAGGGRDLDEINSNWEGFVAWSPDYNLYYTAGSTFDLTILVTAADADTVLLVNDPNGTWVFNDDGGDGLNPRITFTSPSSGLYNIWVGSYYDGVYPNATLAISEMY